MRSESSVDVPANFIHPGSPSSAVWTLGAGLCVTGYSVLGPYRAYHVVAVSDEHLEKKTNPGDVISSAVSDNAPRCTLIFETDFALDEAIRQLTELRALRVREDA